MDRAAATASAVNMRNLIICAGFCGAFLEIAMVGVKGISSDVLAERIAHPQTVAALELLGHCVDVDVEIVGQEVAHFNVLVVADQWPGICAGGGIDVHVNACRYVS